MDNRAMNDSAKNREILDRVTKLSRLIRSELPQAYQEEKHKYLVDTICEAVVRASLEDLGLNEKNENITIAIRILLNVAFNRHQEVSPQQHQLYAILEKSFKYIEYSDVGTDKAPGSHPMTIAGQSLADTVAGRIGGFLRSNRPKNRPPDSERT